MRLESHYLGWGSVARTAAPAALRLVKGRGNGTDSGGRKVPATPGFARLAPSKPDWLSGEASAEWDRVVPELQRLQLLKEIDGAALAAYCESWSEFVEATETLQRTGLTFEAKQGEIPHPCVAIRRNAGKEVRAWASHFGLTPSTEQNLVAASADDGEDNPFI